MNKYIYFFLEVLLTCHLGLAQQKRSNKPNVIIILADDMSAKELSIYGNKDHKTPNIDKLANEGIHFSTCWGAAVCSPARAMLLTGKYAYQTQWYSVRLTPKGDETNACLYKQHSLLSTIAKKAGYVTAMSGKWQMGCGDPTKDWKWDEWSLPYKYLPWQGDICPDSFVLAGQVPMYWGGPFGANGIAKKTTNQDFTEDLHNDFMLDFITRHKNELFFYYYTTNLPHVSWDYENRNPQDIDKKSGKYDWKYVEMPKRDSNGVQLFNQDGSKQKTEGTLNANMEYLDYQVGKLVKKLKELNIYDNTIIIFTADNATTGWKGSVEEELGPRVPLIVKGPGMLKSQKPKMALVDFTDFMPTIAQLMKVDLPENEHFDGKSFAPLLYGQPYKAREWIYTNHDQYRMFRSNQWILDGYKTLWYCGENRNHIGYKKMSFLSNDSSKHSVEFFNQVSDEIPILDTTSLFFKKAKSYYEDYKKVKEIENRTSPLDRP